MLRSESRRFLFVHIQKTAGTSLHSALRAAIPDLSDFLGTHDTALQAKQCLGPAEYDHYYKAVFVRNPWARLVSWYTMIVQKSSRLTWWQKVARRGEYLRLWQYVHENSASFPEFVNNCTAEIADIDGRKSFSRNQIDYLTDENGHMIVDFIGRYENLHADAERLFEQLGLQGVSIPHLNSSEHSHYSAYYTDELADIVRRRYARDIEAFGYEFTR